MLNDVPRVSRANDVIVSDIQSNYLKTREEKNARWTSSSGIDILFLHIFILVSFLFFFFLVFNFKSKKINIVDFCFSPSIAM